jgi:hypothetical protein
MPTGQVFRWQTRIITQPEHDQRRGREAVLLGAEQGGDHHVAPVFIWPSTWSTTCDRAGRSRQHLLRLGEAELPRHARVLERGERRGARAAVVPEMRMTSACALATPAATVPTPDLGDQLHVMRARGLAFLRS